MMLQERVAELKQIIAGNDGRNAADARFSRRVDELLAAIYDDIGQVSDISARALFDLFVIKVLYVQRQSRHADVVDYLAALLEDYLSARRLYPDNAEGRPQRMYFSEALTPDGDGGKTSRAEAYRAYADNALFVSGVLPRSIGVRRRRAATLMRAQRTPGMDATYYVSTGKAMYHMAATHAHSRDETSAKTAITLERLSDGFEIYAEALNEASERYIMGVDRRLITDKMLDSVNRYRASGDAGSLDAARRYAQLLHVASDDPFVG